MLTIAEFIKREALIHLITRRYANPEICTQEINSIPAADVAPVVHGRWIYKGEYAVCTECGGRSGTQYDGVEPIPLMTQFCPNCGAKMDGGQNNERGTDESDP